MLTDRVRRYGQDPVALRLLRIAIRCTADVIVQCRCRNEMAAQAEIERLSQMILISCVILDFEQCAIQQCPARRLVKCRQIFDTQHAALLGYEAHLFKPGELASHGLSVRADPACDFFMSGRRRCYGLRCFPGDRRRSAAGPACTLLRTANVLNSTRGPSATLRPS
jgi:hypothetical protein